MSDSQKKSTSMIYTVSLRGDDTLILNLDNITQLESQSNSETSSETRCKIGVHDRVDRNFFIHALAFLIEELQELSETVQDLGDQEFEKLKLGNVKDNER